MEEFILRPLQEKDAAGMLEWMRDPAISCFFRFDAAAMTLDKCRSFIADSTSEETTRHWAIANSRDEYLGTISLKNIDPERKQAEYAISTRSCAHGTGAAMAATRQVLAITFGELGLNRVYLNVLADNVRANRFYQKAGFRFDRREENALEIKGQIRDLNWYFITK